MKIAVSYPVPDDLVSPGFSVEVVAPVTLGVFGPPMTQVDYKLNELSYLDAAMRAHEAGADAYFMNSGGDYGLWEARSILPIPIISGGQVGMLVAMTLGSRFSIVTVWPEETNYIHALQVSSNGLDDRCASIRNVVAQSELAQVSDHHDVLARLNGAETTIVDRIVEQIRCAVDDDGADVVVLGCTCMSPVAALLAERSDVPVVDPMRVGYRLTETLLSLGLAPAGRGTTPSLLAAGSLGPMLATACDVAGRPGLDVCGEACEVLAGVDGLT